MKNSELQYHIDDDHIGVQGSLKGGLKEAKGSAKVYFLLKCVLSAVMSVFLLKTTFSYVCRALSTMSKGLEAE